MKNDEPGRSKSHRRWEGAGSPPQQDQALSPEAKKRILSERARALAREREAAPPTGEHIEVVELLVAHERYGIESSLVREVCPLKNLAPLPGAPPFLLGIVNVRGHILPVMDLKRIFDLPQKGLTERDRIVVLEQGGVELGILADAVPGVLRVPLAEVQSSLPTLTGVRGECLKGVARNGMVILDPGKLLDQASRFKAEMEPRTGSQRSHQEVET